MNPKGNMLKVLRLLGKKNQIQNYYNRIPVIFGPPLDNSNRYSNLIYFNSKSIQQIPRSDIITNINYL